MAVQPIPEGYRGVTPYLSVDGAAQAIDFYQRAFGAVELFRMPGADGKIGHAEIKIGDGVVMLTDEHPAMEFVSPKKLGGTPLMLLVYVTDVDAVFAQAVTAGATVVREVQNQFYGDRSGVLTDPFGHRWILSTHIEDLTPEEMAKRAAAMDSKDC